MTDFSFDATAGASQSTAKPRLPGNNIYAVKFDGCEIKDIQGVKDPTQLYRVLSIKFSNDVGSHDHTIFEPKQEDYQRTEREFTNKNGNVEKIPQASGLESLMLLLKHVIDAVNPTVAKQIDTGEKKLGARDWNGLRNLINDILNAGKGAETKIKLLKNNKGEATFPGFFTAVNRDGKAYIRNNFIGEKVAFTAYEIDRIKNESIAKPTDTTSLLSFEAPEESSKGSDLNLDFDVASL
jgi:hypothetical protein